MSRIGKLPIEVPKGVEVSVHAALISVKGPKGQLSRAVHPLVQCECKDDQLHCQRKKDSRQARAAHGLMRALIFNMVHGVSQGFERSLQIHGVGYRAEVKGKTLVLNLGYSHPIHYELPAGVTAKVDKNEIILSCIDKEALGAAAAKIRGFRSPEPYKGKGIKYAEEQIVRKSGKAAG